jgi:hypothetical protein
MRAIFFFLTEGLKKLVSTSIVEEEGAENNGVTDPPHSPLDSALVRGNESSVSIT